MCPALGPLGGKIAVRFRVKPGMTREGVLTTAPRLCIFDSEQMCRCSGEYGGVGRMQFAKGAVKMYIVEDLWP